MLTIAGLAGCAPAPRDVPPAVASAHGCDARAIQPFIGKRATSEVVASARVAAGAAVVRTLLPGSMATMDYREDRLNLDLDAQGTIRSARCG